MGWRGRWIPLNKPETEMIIRNSHGTKEIRRRIGLGANQKLSGEFLLEGGGKEISGKKSKS
jgi:hypothetical protein